MAGRDISTTKLGLASTRIIGCCAIGGEAVGIAAALCKKYGCNPRELMPHIKELQQLILKDDGYLPGYINEDPADHALRATFTATSQKANGAPEQVKNGISRKIGDDMNAWISDGIAEGGEVLTMKLDAPQTLSQLRLTFYSDFAYPIRVTMAPNRQKQQRDGVPAELVKDYTVILKKNGETVREIEVKGNYQRHNVLDFEPTLCDTAEIRVTATNGIEDAWIYEVRAY